MSIALGSSAPMSAASCEVRRLKDRRHDVQLLQFHATGWPEQHDRYAPDVPKLPNAENTLRRISVYIGDGATMKRSVVRKQNGTLIGHAPMTVQLGWCERAGVRRAIFTHCGSAIVRGQPQRLSAALRQLGSEHGVAASLASEGDRLSLGGG
jgi:hypothetical protein